MQAGWPAVGRGELGRAGPSDLLITTGSAGPGLTFRHAQDTYVLIYAISLKQQALGIYIANNKPT